MRKFQALAPLSRLERLVIAALVTLPAVTAVVVLRGYFDAI
jgi:hypothetical protein